MKERTLRFRRWTTWAQSIRERLQARVTANCPCRFVYSRTMAIVQRVLERVERQPRPITIRLSIAPLLRAVWSSAHHHARTHNTLVRSTSSSHVRLLLGRTHASREVRTLRETQPPPRARRPRASARFVALAERQRPTHLDSVLQRIRHESHTVRFATQIRTRSVRLVRTIRTRSRPVESQPKLPPAARVFRMSRAVPANGGSVASPWIEGAPAPRPNPRPHRATTVPAAPVDIESITNQVMRQIDRRLHAWRERTGRV